MTYAICALIFGFFCFVYGWQSAHLEVSRECETVGFFHVGPTYYRCHKVENWQP